MLASRRRIKTPLLQIAALKKLKGELSSYRSYHQASALLQCLKKMERGDTLTSGNSTG